MTDNRQRNTVLIVEDDQALQALLEDEMVNSGYHVLTAYNAEKALQIIGEHHVDLVISDMRLPGSTGMELLLAVRQFDMTPAFIMITAFGTVEQAVEALKQGADDFLTKPLKLEHLQISVDRVLRTRRLQVEVTRYRELLGDEVFHGMIGRSQVMNSLFDAVRMTAYGDGHVLVYGESGTGKELVARAVHAESSRSDGPFVVLNCAGIPAELLESELFGHTAGAFTNARGERKGLFTEAHGGTILLDEIGEMPMAMQAKLLRVLQDGKVRPVGSNTEQQLDVRVIAVTNRDLENEIRLKNFREDLYFRLQTFSISVPSLRDRGDDIELLTAYFIKHFNLKLQRDISTISPAALACIKAYPFPGNVRELSSAMERAMTFCRAGEIHSSDLPDRIRNSGRGRNQRASTYPESLLYEDALPTLQEMERRYIDLVLDRHAGNKRRAAETLGIGRRTLYRRLGEISEN